jgi:UDP-N-acetyl-D-glucosamine dehydrogenase
VFPRTRKHHFELASTPLTPESLGAFDCVLLATNHEAFDYELVRRHAKLIVDTRGVYPYAAPNIVRA